MSLSKNEYSGWQLQYQQSFPYNIDLHRRLLIIIHITRTKLSQWSFFLPLTLTILTCQGKEMYQQKRFFNVFSFSLKDIHTFSAFYVNGRKMYVHIWQAWLQNVSAKWYIKKKNTKLSIVIISWLAGQFNLITLESNQIFKACILA